ncbi:MAG: hypothetical protein IK143_05895 [Bacteroidales bacterium]|nr:hypothetical protein [Bacteroidales bacterium]
MKTLRGFQVNDWTIEEQWDGRWKVYYAERGVESYVKYFIAEEEACEYYIVQLKYFFTMWNY